MNRALWLRLAAMHAVACTGTDAFRASEWTPPFTHGGITLQARRGGPTGPGNNRWSRPLVRHGELTLRSGARSTEICTLPVRPPIRMRIILRGRLDTLGSDVVLGVFLYRNDESEFDFEVSRWGNPEAANGQLVAVNTGRLWRFELERVRRTILELDWHRHRVVVRVQNVQVRRQWSVPITLDEPHRLHLNLWSRRVREQVASVVVESIAMSRP